jgi:hypothetical protein
VQRTTAARIRHNNDDDRRWWRRVQVGPIWALMGLDGTRHDVSFSAPTMFPDPTGFLLLHGRLLHRRWSTSFVWLDCRILVIRCLVPRWRGVAAGENCASLWSCETMTTLMHRYLLKASSMQPSPHPGYSGGNPKSCFSDWTMATLGAVLPRGRRFWSRCCLEVVLR